MIIIKYRFLIIDFLPHSITAGVYPSCLRHRHEELRARMNHLSMIGKYISNRCQNVQDTNRPYMERKYQLFTWIHFNNTTIWKPLLN